MATTLTVKPLQVSLLEPVAYLDIGYRYGLHDLRRRLLVEERDGIRMVSQYRGWTPGGDGFFYRSLDDLSFSRTWNGEEELRDPKQAGHGQRDGPRRNFGNAVKSTLIHLLLPARWVGRNHLDFLRISEISRSRIVKRQVPVFPYSDKAEQGWMSTQQIRVFPAHMVRVSIGRFDLREALKRNMAR